MNTSSSNDDGFLPDEVLVARVRVGDAAAFAELVGRHEGKTRRQIMRVVHNQHDAQEILQEVFLSVWRKLPNFEGRAQLASWLYRVAVNTSLMSLRAHGRHPEIVYDNSDLAKLCIARGVEDEFPGMSRPREPVELLQSMELRGQFQKALDRLPDRLRTVFVVRHVDGLSTARAARSLGLTHAAVKTRLQRARRALREDMRSYLAC